MYIYGINKFSQRIKISVMQGQIKNTTIKQIVLLLLIVLFLITILWNLSYFIPGFLGAVTLFVVFRDPYFKVIENRKWKPSLAALVFIFGFLVAFALPVYIAIAALIPMINQLLENPESIISSATQTIDYINTKFPDLSLSTATILEYLQKGLTIVPKILQSTASLFANIFAAVFILYFMLVKGRALEQIVSNNLPFHKPIKNVIWKETKTLIVSNALGLPLLALIQGIVACIGYWIFGVPNAVLWGLLTAFATAIPVIGTMVIWVPIVIYLLSLQSTGAAIGLSIYSLVAVGGVDNVLRMFFAKMFGNVHPLVTIFGVLLGIELFGLMGLVFGPVIISYLILLVKIYKVEFGGNGTINETTLSEPEITTNPAES